MRTLFLLCALLVAALPAGATVYTENFESYSTGALAGQSGWYIFSGNSRANVFSPDNGPSLSGSKCVKLDNLVSGSTGIRLFKNITDLVSTDKILTIQYDVRNLTNASGKSPTTFRMRVYDSVLSNPAIGNIHYDGGADPNRSGPASRGRAWAARGGPPARGHAQIPIAEAKKRPADETVTIGGVVTAVYDQDTPPRFYIQEASGYCGIQVRYSGSPPAMNQAVTATGKLYVDSSNHELHMDPTGGWQGGAIVDAARTVALNSRALGGGALGRQEAVWQGDGLNNIGTLVTVCGKVTASTPAGLVVSDGSGVTEGGDTPGIRIDTSGVRAGMRPDADVGHCVTVTGISSLYPSSGQYHRVVRPRSGADLVNNSVRTFKVLVINFDPICPNHANKRIHEWFNWNDPDTLAQDYVADLKECSTGFARYQVVDWYDANYLPYYEDGFAYTGDEYIGAWENRETTPMHYGTADYYRICLDKTYPHNQPRSIAERVAAGEVEEVILFGPPCTSYFLWYSSMAGPSPFFVNGGTYSMPQAGRNFILMGFTYDADVWSALLSYLRRSECIMNRVYPPANWWFPTWPITNNWEKFRMLDVVHPGDAACGTANWAPNSANEFYDFGNTRDVWSTCDDWLYNWPNLLGTKKQVNCTEWGGGDYRLHHKWWLKHIPNAPGVNPDGKQNNWWKYLCDYNSYPESR